MPTDENRTENPLWLVAFVAALATAWALGELVQWLNLFEGWRTALPNEANECLMNLAVVGTPLLLLALVAAGSSLRALTRRL